MQFGQSRVLHGLVVWLAVIGILVGASLPTRPVAALVEPFNPVFIITDEEFNDAAAMSCDQIQAFLNERTGILKTYVDPVNGKYASQIICEQAVTFGINPRLILVMIQKEMRMLTETEPDERQIAWSAGCGPGWDSTAGFTNQIECVARTLRKRYDNAELGGSVDGIAPFNRATLALYRYTTHVDGNEDFWKIWTRYFAGSGNSANMPAFTISSAPPASPPAESAPATTAAAAPAAAAAPSVGGAVETIIVDSRNLELTPALNTDSACRSGWAVGTRGMGGHHLATPNVAEPGNSTNAATWRPTIAVAGIYRVSVFVPNRVKLDWACGDMPAKYDTTHATYTVQHRDGVTSYAVNQEPLHDEWVSLGTYYFDVGTAGSLTVSDLTGEPDNSRWVSIDEAKFEWVQP